MKRPEGFDAAAPPPVPPPDRKSARSRAQPRAVKPTPTPPKPKPRVAKPVASGSPPSPKPDAAAKADLRRQTRDRRRFEKAEVRRFTRRARNRRVMIAVVAGTLVTLIGLVIAAVYSPILALRQVSVDGTSRISADEVVTALSGQLGTPLALIDFGEITTQLSAFPLIRSYVTETVPPDKLIVHIVERQPVGSIKVGETFRLVDPAGVTVAESPQRAPGVPVIDIAGADISTPAFASVVEVLLALPPELLVQVDTVSARTQDDVSLVLAGVGQRVTWGSASDSAAKAALLSALIAVTDPSAVGEFDVSAPSNGVFRPAP